MNANDAHLLLKMSQVQTLQELVDLAPSLLGNPVFIDDMYRNILAYSQNVEIDDPLWQENIVENIHDESSGSQMTSKNNYKQSLEVQHPILLSDLPTVPRYAMTLTQYGVPIGNATLAAHLRPFAPGDEALFEFFCHYASEILGSSHYSVRRSQPIAINTLIRLLDGDQMPRNAVESKLSFYQKDSCKSFLFLLSDESGDALACPRQAIIDTLSRIPGMLAFSYQSYILGICGYEDSKRETLEKQLLTILEQYRLYAGISNHIKDIMLLPHYYSQAQTALRLNALAKDKRLYSYDSVAVFDLFNQLSSSCDLMEFCEESLLELLAYDQAHEGNLLKTLQVYFENGLQYEQTARELFVHKNTVRYRITKCQQLLHTDFTDGQKNFQYILSLKILEYFHYL